MVEADPVINFTL